MTAGAVAHLTRWPCGHRCPTRSNSKGWVRLASSASPRSLQNAIYRTTGNHPCARSAAHSGCGAGQGPTLPVCPPSLEAACDFHQVEDKIQATQASPLTRPFTVLSPDRGVGKEPCQSTAIQSPRTARPDAHCPPSVTRFSCNRCATIDPDREIRSQRFRV